MRRVRGLLRISLSYNILLLFSTDASIYVSFSPSYLRDFFTRHLPALPVTPLEATYLVWVDCRTLKRPTTEIARQLLEEGHVWINEGEMYAGEGFLRINIACPRKTLAEGLERIRKVVG